jgi:hypothetical protein
MSWFTKNPKTAEVDKNERNRRLKEANAAASEIQQGIHKKGPTPIIHRPRGFGFLPSYKDSLRPTNYFYSGIIDELLAKAAKVHLNSSEQDQVNTVKRVYTTLQLRATNGKEYDAMLGDYRKLLQGDFSFSKTRNTFKYLRNAQTNRYKADSRKQSIEIQQIRAYNEILGLILSISAKAQDKFKARTITEYFLKRFENKTIRVDNTDAVKSLQSELALNNKNAGVYSLANIEHEYVYDVIARGKVRDLVNLRDNFTKRFLSEIKRHKEASYSNPSNVSRKVVGGSGLAAILGGASGSLIAFWLVATGSVVFPLGPLILAGIVAAAGIGIAGLVMVSALTLPKVVDDSILAYKTITGILDALSTRKTMTFKEEFIELHKILFNDLNTINFKKATTHKDFFMYNQLSQKEKNAIMTIKEQFYSGNPTDDQIMTYVNILLQANNDRRIEEKLGDIMPEQAAKLAPLANQIYPQYTGWDLSYNPITRSFTYDCASDPSITAWPEPGPFSILNPEYCKTCPNAHCTAPPRPVKVGGSRRIHKKGHRARRKTRRK